MEEVQRRQILYTRFAGFIISFAFNNIFYRLFNSKFYRKKHKFIKKLLEVFLLRKPAIELLCLYLLNKNCRSFAVGPYGLYKHISLSLTVYEWLCWDRAEVQLDPATSF